MQGYTIVKTWKIKAPIEDVWGIIYDTHNWPKWWTIFSSVIELIKGFDTGSGSMTAFTLRKRYFKLKFHTITTRVDYMKSIECDIYGDVHGSAEWGFSQKDGFTYIQYKCTGFRLDTHWYIVGLAIKLLFKLGYNYFIKSGAKSLSQKLGSEVEVIA